MSSNQWVDFERVKAEVPIAEVLAEYGLQRDMKRRGDELVGTCPIHANADYEKDSFAANTVKNIWQCFSCGASGNVLDFVMAMEDVSVREAALKLQEWFHIDTTPEQPKQAREGERSEPTPDKGTEEPEHTPVNPPLDFTLKSLDPEHEYLTERGLTADTISTFGLGYCNRGLLKGRIAIPIHNTDGQLVAYAGRWPGQPPEGEPKYKLPPNFTKQVEVFNLHRVKLPEPVPALILVEGFFDVFSLWQAGFSNAVATMGTVLSDTQRKLIVDTVGSTGKVTVLFDGDEPGIEAAREVRNQLVEHVYVKWIRLQAGMQPDTMDTERLTELLG